MKNGRKTMTVAGFLVSATLGLVAMPKTPKISAEDLAFFETKVRPVLEENCYKCHSRDADKIKGGLLLDSREGLMHGGYTGDAVVPGNPAESLLIIAINHADEDMKMPSKRRKLADHEIADLTEWVMRGAPDPRTREVDGTYAGVGKNHWAFQKVTKPEVPAATVPKWGKSPVDNFIAARLTQVGLKPSPAADKHTLLRRVTFDLTGLPPTREELMAFIRDKSPDAFARVVDRLLASPHYGEHWGRYWLDVARYADTKGDARGREDPRYPHAWTYRDYVIDAFNSDKPYDQFILEQLAADRLVAVDAKGRYKQPAQVKPAERELLAAMGFLTLGNQFNGRRNDQIDDQIDVTTKAFLGLTVSCARCHDHKFDPIPTEDYYSLYGIFANSITPKELPATGRVRPTPEVLDYAAKRKQLKTRAMELTEKYADYRKNRENYTAQQRRELQNEERRVLKEIGDLETQHPGAPARAHALFDNRRIRDYPVLLRGEAGNRGDMVPRRFLEVLSDADRPKYDRKSSGRLELAQAIADPTNPLTARVLVNRVWQQHFGEGFVPTPDDLGNMSALPSHPKLLDYLAAEFVENGWSIKNLHRQILLSATYQQSSEANEAYAEIDPDNHLLWRANLRRLDIEEVHDSMLAMAGMLDTSQIGGKPVHIGSAEFAQRRAVYTWIDRQNPAELFTQFDFPNPDIASGRRYETIVPQQSLFLMNSPLVIETARALVLTPEFEQAQNNRQRGKERYLRIFQRPPSDREFELCLQYLRSIPQGLKTDMPAPTKMSRAMSKGAKRQVAQAERMQMSGGRARGQLEPAAAAFPERNPLNGWTKLAHALFQTNEAMFVN
ncbi:MAG: PSD1 and planctomycete cytochrome C domain-containing protein [Synoicihabitans sp.]